MKMIKLGISACLLGGKVRYDGGHKRDRFITGTLGKRFALVPVCPEVEAGLSIPREPMQLQGSAAGPRLLVISSGIDLTGVVSGWAGRKLTQLERGGLCGFILKSRSPSCAIDDADLVAFSGKAKGRTSGLFSALVMKRYPHLPLINEEDLADTVRRENFVERVLVYQRWLVLNDKRPSVGKLVSFHASHKLQVMAHSPRHYAALGKLVAGAKGMPLKAAYQQYITTLMEGLSSIATPGKNANVLMHVMGYFKKRLSAAQKQEILKAIERYRRAQIPLTVPVTLLRQYARRYGEQYLQTQTYLAHPNAAL